ncbi:amino acid permease [Pseudonocardia xinjiangensis]|uniref:amino acid permease n=1 Tax=Pseudonocardia xinjiangensis TaxID=75289 RepID=UPI0028AFAAFB|nr:amino acid permease [Pseudonocardia xinjiangensis]
MKSVEQSLANADEPGRRLRKELGALDLVVFGVAVVVGAGIFSVTASIAGDVAGPSVSLAFVIAAVACGLAALCYAEFASIVPVAGSAYTYSYATFGELLAWVVGWDLVLECGVGAALVSRAWSAYLVQFLGLVGVPLPATELRWGAIGFDWAALLIAIALTTVLVLGVKMSSRVSKIITAFKVLVVVLVVAVGARYVKASNYTPFIPPSTTSRCATNGGSSLHESLLTVLGGRWGGSFGVGGLFAAASLVFFAFVGFDIVATAAEETRNPQKAVPRGILGALVPITVLYVAVSLVLTGMVDYTALATRPDGTTATLATAFALNGVGWAVVVISLGALTGLTTVVLVAMLGQTRVLLAMSRDGLLPRHLARINSADVPARSTLIVGAAVELAAAFIPADTLGEMVNIGTLFAFLLVSTGVIILRRTRPELPRAFRTPMMPLIPILSVLACLWLMINLTIQTWLRFVIWMAVGLVVYGGYGRRHSQFSRRQD